MRNFNLNDTPLIRSQSAFIRLLNDRLKLLFSSLQTSEVNFDQLMLTILLFDKYL